MYKFSILIKLKQYHKQQREKDRKAWNLSFEVSIAQKLETKEKAKYKRREVFNLVFLKENFVCAHVLGQCILEMHRIWSSCGSWS